MCPRSDPGTESPPRMRGKETAVFLSAGAAWITPAYAGKSPFCVSLLNSLQGSPPRMRGKGTVYVFAGIHGGITPAYAGKSGFASGFSFSYGDHPRVCGEKAAFHRLHLVRLGSPPRMRGKVIWVMMLQAVARITPAYAGKSCGYFVVCRYLQDHPRVCGEKNGLQVIRNCKQGSPPRMRGKDSAPQVYHRQGGITPAYAGKRELVYR